ncbi:MAG: TIR domain-containing protein [Anaerolineae bacterium]|nr:TIR domain-containing protein [Anaerolineae bacterium]
MTPTHAVAFVNYKYYRTSDENMARFGQAFTYISKKPRVLQLVGDGGTLWIVTSFPIARGRRYSLAYKLVKCKPLVVPDHLRRLFGDYGVIGSFKDSWHYPRNSLTNVLMSLEFVPPRPIHDPSVIGMSLMTARQLSEADVVMLEQYEERLLFGKRIFISYSSKDRRRAERLEGELLAHGQTVWRDVTSIPGGEEWARKIDEALAKTDVLLLLVSEHSAQSKWVRREMEAALSRYGKTNGIQRVVPVVLAQSAWADFPELHRFQRYTWTDPAQAVPQKVIDDLKLLE